MRVKLALLAGLLLVAFSWATLADDPLLTFGPRGISGTLYARQNAFVRRPGLIVKAQVKTKDVLLDSAVLRQTGGGLLVSTAQPDSALLGKKLQLNYSPSMQDGERVQVLIANKTSILDAYDWEIQPLTHFVDSDHNGSINIDISSQLNIRLDDAFVDTLLGLRIIQSDLIPRYVLSQTYLPQINDQLILGSGEKAVLTDNAEADRAAAHFLASVGLPPTTFTVITDAGVPFPFRLLGRKISISGRPFLYAWNLAREVGNAVAPDLEYNAKFAANWALLQKANPVLVRSIERTYQLTAFLRYQKSASPDNWTNFVHQVDAIELSPIRTPSVLSKE
jgi:hypothetical protein